MTQGKLIHLVLLLSRGQVVSMEKVIFFQMIYSIETTCQNVYYSSMYVYVLHRNVMLFHVLFFLFSIHMACKYTAWYDSEEARNIKNKQQNEEAKDMYTTERKEAIRNQVAELHQQKSSFSKSEQHIETNDITSSEVITTSEQQVQQSEQHVTEWQKIARKEKKHVEYAQASHFSKVFCNYYTLSRMSSGHIVDVYLKRYTFFVAFFIKYIGQFFPIFSKLWRPQISSNLSNLLMFKKDRKLNLLSSLKETRHRLLNGSVTASPWNTLMISGSSMITTDPL